MVKIEMSKFHISKKGLKMTIKNKILTGLVLSTILSSGLYAVNGEMKNDKNRSTCMMKSKSMSGHKHDESFGTMKLFKQLSLSDEQRNKIEKIMFESRQNMKTINDAFSKDSFDKDKYIQIMSEKRDNMLKSKAEVMEKSYAVLTSKQKEQLKVLMDLKKEKMNQRIQEKIKG